MELTASMVFFTCSVTCYKRVSVMVVMKCFNASIVAYALLLGSHYPTESGVPCKLSEASATSRAVGTSIIGALSLRVRTQMALLTTIIHRSLPTDGAKFVLGQTALQG